MKKICSKCGQLKGVSLFNKHKTAKGGLHPWCTPCRVLNNRKRRQLAPEVYRARNKRWYNKNRAKADASTKKWRKANPEKMASVYSRYQKRYPDRIAMRSAKRRAARMRATPSWANQFFISEIYDLSRLRTKLTGIKWHVDHIVPLRNKFVCGLHVEHNLRVIPAAENCRKNNTTWPHMSGIPEPLEQRFKEVAYA